MINVNLLLEGFDAGSFRTLDFFPKDDVEAVHTMAVGVRNLWLRNVVSK